MTCFHFKYYSLYLTILNLIIISKINLQWSCLPAFSYPPCKQFKLKRTYMKKLNFKHHDGVSRMFWFFGISKICGFVLGVINHSEIKNSILNVNLMSKSWPHPPLTEITMYIFDQIKDPHFPKSFNVISHQHSILHLDRTSWNCNISYSLNLYFLPNIISYWNSFFNENKK